MARLAIPGWLAVLAFGIAGPAAGSGFCDDHGDPEGSGAIPVQPLGGYCTQQRTSYLQLNAVTPDYSDSDLRTLDGFSTTPLTFYFDPAGLKGALQLVSPVTVLELSIVRPALQGNGAVGRHVLSMGISLTPGGEWILRFDWLPTQPDWSAVSTPTPSPLSSIVLPSVGGGRGAFDRFVVTLSPSQDWQSIAVEVKAAVGPLGAENLSALGSAKFLMPPNASSPPNTPERLRTGVLGRVLPVPGMQSQFWFAPNERFIEQ